MLIGWHHDERIFEIGLPRGLLPFPDLVQTLSADASAEVGVELLNVQHQHTKKEVLRGYRLEVGCRVSRRKPSKFIS